jgi:hypothetical protein
LILWVAFSCGVATTVIAQAKDGFYCDWFPMDMFLHLHVEVFKCLHQQANEFFHRCANIEWVAKGNGGLPFLVLCAFCRQKVLMVLQHAQEVSILRWAVAVGEGCLS